MRRLRPGVVVFLLLILGGAAGHVAAIFGARGDASWARLTLPRVC